MKYTMLEGEEEFLAMLLDDPHDETNRLVYADWLESQGDERAEWLRCEAEFHAIARRSDHHRHRPIRKRLRALLPRIEPEWGLAVTRDPYAIATYHMWGEEAPFSTATRSDDERVTAVVDRGGGALTRFLEYVRIVRRRS